MRGHCGRSMTTFRELPCPYNGPPVEVSFHMLEDYRGLFNDPLKPDDDAKRVLADVCGYEFAEGPVCCTSEQVDLLQQNFEVIEALIGSCPACRNNFRSFFCSFTCSPLQGTYVNVTSTQTSTDGTPAVKSLDFFVGDEFSTAFYDSCAEVKMSASNDYAMSFIGGGAKDASAFLKFLGDEKDVGSPFQINFPREIPPDFADYNPRARNCADDDLQSRCTCIDCAQICPSLEPVDPPNPGPSCTIGALSCLTFVLTNFYALLVIGVLLTYAVQLLLRSRRNRKYGRIALAGEDPSDNPLSPRSHSRSLVGASSLAMHADGADSTGGQSGESRHLGRGASLLDPIETLQPRQYRLNVILRRLFYRLGLLCASYPWLTLSAVLTLVGLLNIGWKYFEIETDPVRLWVSPDSDSKLQKEYFDQHFGPFYRPQQIFVTSSPSSAVDDTALRYPNTSAGVPGFADDFPSLLSFENLKWWAKIESDIRSIRSPQGYSLADVCFAPSGPDTPCVVQSITAWFGDGLDSYEDTWEQRIADCANAPTECLPDFMQPLYPRYILGGVPEESKTGDPRDWLAARALVVTVVVNDSLDPEIQEKAMDWERALRKYLQDLSVVAPGEQGLQVHFSTGVSLEEEINKSTNMDVRIVVLSYLVVFFYVAWSLGNNSVTPGEEGAAVLLLRWAVDLPRYFKNKLSTSAVSMDEHDSPRLLPRLPRAIFVNSKVMLGLFGIAIVILSVSSSVGFFSVVGVKTTLIIAEVIPFLVLAVGVDNVFILVHELDRQNMLHGPNAISNPRNTNGGSAATTLISPAYARPSTFSSSQEDSVDAESVPIHFTAEERVARALAKMGPSILLSSITETTAFALGALVPMPAVRNFALYAAGSVFLNALLQVTAFVSALTVDLHRQEVCSLYYILSTVLSKYLTG